MHRVNYLFLFYAVLSSLAFAFGPPALPASLYKQASQAAKAEDYLAVVECANQILIKSPKNLQGLCLRAFANYKLGNYDKAIIDFELAKTLKCRTIDRLLIYEGLIKDYAAAGQIETAIFKCTEALQIKTLFDLERDDILILRGRLYVMQKKYDLAQADFKEAIKIDLGENVYAQRELSWLNWIVTNKSTLSHIIETPVSLPFYYDNGHIKVMLTVNGIKDLPFIIDTGYSISVLNKNSTGVIDVQYTKQSGHITGGLGEKVKYKTGLINNIILSKDMSIVNTPISVQELSNISDTTGILGTDFIKQFLVTINYKDRIITFRNSDYITPNAQNWTVPLHYDLGTNEISVQADLDYIHNIRFLIDTGASMNSLPAALASKVGVAAISKYVGIKSLHRKCLVKCVDVPKFVISSLEIPTVRFYYPADPSGAKLYAGAALGNEFLSQFTTSFDYAHNQLIFEPYSATDKSKLPSSTH